LPLGLYRLWGSITSRAQLLPLGLYRLSGSAIASQALLPLGLCHYPLGPILSGSALPLTKSLQTSSLLLIKPLDALDQQGP